MFSPGRRRSSSSEIPPWCGTYRNETTSDSSCRRRAFVALIRSRGIMQVMEGAASPRSHRPVHGFGDPAALLHKLAERGRSDRLGAIADSVLGVVVHLDDQRVGSGGNGCL